MRGDHALMLMIGAVLGLGLACTRLNERYCEADKDCPRGELCDVRKSECQFGSVGDMASGVVDMAGRADFSDPPDSATPDLLPPPPECTKDSECAAKAATPACVNTRCVPCTRNYQCPNAACTPVGSSGAGSCVDKGRMIYVDNNVVNCSATGAGGKPFCRVDQAMGWVSASKDVILLRASNVAYQNDGNFLNITKSVRIVGERADRLAAPPSFTDPVTVYPGAAAIDFVMEDLSVKLQNAGDTTAVRCSRSMLSDKSISTTLRWMRFDGNPSMVLLSDGCNDTRILNSVIVRNTVSQGSGYAAVTIVGGNVKIANTVISGNTPPSSTRGGGLYLGEIAPFKLAGIDLSFNTIADNTCASGACNLQSDVATSMNFSIVTGAAPTVVSSSVILNNSVTPTGYNMGTGNVMPPGLVPKFVNAPLGDYHLTSDAANSVLRLATNGTPIEITDIDSDPRPSADGKVDVGADQRVP